MLCVQILLTPHTAFWLHWERGWTLTHISGEPFPRGCISAQFSGSWIDLSMAFLGWSCMLVAILFLLSGQWEHPVYSWTVAPVISLDCASLKNAFKGEDYWDLRYHCLATPHSSATHSNTLSLDHPRFSSTGSRKHKWYTVLVSAQWYHHLHLGAFKLGRNGWELWLRISEDATRACQLSQRTVMGPGPLL